ncbi:MAG: glyoxalase [Rhodobacteraceae bacterium]|nr:glyoxalase [Paracoccaceae bacterium]
MPVAHGIFYWNELMTRDVEGAKAFYGAALGWTFAPMPMPDGTYWLVMASGEAPVAGLFDIHMMDDPQMQPHWMSYIAVDDVDARLEAAVGAGGSILRPPFDVEGVGRIAIVRDPEGAVTGWMTPVEPA